MIKDCVLITGGGSGIGMGLAAAFYQRGATVIIAGRTEAKLQAVAAQYPGMEVEWMDVADPDSIAACAARVSDRHPNLNWLINNAGIQKLVDFSLPQSHSPTLLAEEIDINLKGLINVTNTFLPLLKRQSAAHLVHIGSALGYVPLAAAPIYSATKAAVHSFTISLRQQLKDSTVRVVEIIPPVVETDLHRGQARQPPGALSLDAFVKSAIAGLDAGQDEIPVGLAKVLKIASRVAPGLSLNIVNKLRE
jgi:uncharacterized oxidoreductase